VIATSITLATKPPYLVAILLFFAPLALWLSYRTPGPIVRAAVFSLCAALPAGIITNVLGVQDRAWNVPNTLFPFRVLGIVPIEDLVLFVLLAYTIVMFHEHFLHKSHRTIADHKMKYLLIPLFLVFSAFLIAVASDVEATIPYAYLWFSTLLVAVPVFAYLAAFPTHISHYIKVGAYFSALLLLFEFVGLHFRYWVFTGERLVGWIPLLGFRIPVEEFIFWCVLSSVAILSYYEFFDEKGDKKAL
jgi:hypothetical protein